MNSAIQKNKGAEGRRIRVRGLVQGVGFRPNVWRLAHDHGLRGEVLNDGAGVLIRAWGERGTLDDFTLALEADAPPLSRIDSVEWDALSGEAEVPDFHISGSVSDGAQTGVVPDAATCQACGAEVADPSNRRYRYPFTNCTHCGPRLSIVRAIPYDRKNTAMATFEMCPTCQREYDDPADRRFHAQPNACPDCGPRLWLSDASGTELDLGDHRDALEAAADMIKQGRIVAIKGIGGFHLACDAGNPSAVDELRNRKHRYGKPFALMASDTSTIADYVHMDENEAAALVSAAAPIVVMARKEASLPVVPLADAVAPGQDALGFMLPYTPMHAVLMAQLDRPIVLTSGNRSDEPQAIANSEAQERLADIADAWLMHDRDIVNRLDDSVVWKSDGAVRALRRARGFAPAPLPMPDGFGESPAILAAGGELKNTFCLIKDGHAIVSQHMGDQEHPAAHADFRRNIDLYRDVHQFTPDLIAVDMHPDYIPTSWGISTAAQADIPYAPVQHHHAHVASVMAEHGWALDAGPVLGVVLDGLGFGADDELWGGEFFVCDYAGFRRARHFDAVPLIGGAKAMVEPWRNVLAHLVQSFGADTMNNDFSQFEFVAQLNKKPISTCIQMLERGVNVPPASSAGRLFDAVAAALGICFDGIDYEGEAAIRLENLARRADPDVGHYAVPRGEVLKWRDMWADLLADIGRGTELSIIGRRFHNTVIHTVHAATREIASAEGLKNVVLTGGVFQNTILLAGVGEALRADGFQVLTPTAFPANDGGISLGQAAIAAARFIRQEIT